MFLFGIFSSRRSLRDFSSCCLSRLRRFITDWDPVREPFTSAGELSRRFGAAGADNLVLEKSFAALYLRIERCISEEQPSERTSVEELRSDIFTHCGADRAEGGFPLLFFPLRRKRMRLFLRFANEILRRLPGLTGTDNRKEFLKTFRSDERLAGVFDSANGICDAEKLERKLATLGSPPEIQEEIARTFFKNLLLAAYRQASLAIGSVRADLMFAQVYEEEKERLAFLPDYAQVLFAVPDELLKQERVEIMEKSELADTVRQRTRDLEIALKELQKEKEKLAKAYSQLQISDAAKGEFVDVVSHQFRTPLSVIRWNTEMLAEEVSRTEETDRAKLEPFIATTEGKVAFLIDALENIYDVLAFDGGTAAIEKTPGQLWEIVNDAVKQFEKYAREKGVALQFDRANAPVTMSRFDAAKIKRALEIVIGNALQYTQNGGSVSVSISEEKKEGESFLRCVVADTGIGISAGDLSKIFTKFFRTKEAIKMVPDGAGLGLYLAKKIVGAHGGSIVATSEPGKGSVFTVTIPGAE